MQVGNCFRLKTVDLSVPQEPLRSTVKLGMARSHPAGLCGALEKAIMYLACHARRAQPTRDRHTGRAQLGLEPLFGSDDVIEFAEAA
jgi:hypothetical protein